MIKLDSTYKDCYFLCEDGTLYNSDTGKYIKADKRHSFYLLTSNGYRKNVSLRTLYRELYNKEYCKDDIEDLSGEKWKEVQDTNGKYYVSNKGRIKSLQRYSAKILNPYKTKKGYLRVDIDVSGHRTSVLVHRLVAAAFLLPPSRIDMQVHHIDFNSLNNAADNLEWLSPSEHSKKHNRKEIKQNVCTKPKEDIY